jgi:hypothetical protein
MISDDESVMTSDTLSLSLKPVIKNDQKQINLIPFHYNKIDKSNFKTR